MAAESPGFPASTRAGFHTTRWSLVAAAGGDASRESNQALNELCAAYWRPIYAEIRRRGHASADAQDLTQEFMARLLRQNSFGRAEEHRGRLRSYLLAALDHFLANDRRDRSAQKRGGGMEMFSLDAAEAESWYEERQANGATPAEAYDQRWALILMDRALAALRAEYERSGRGDVFAAAQPYLAAETGGDGYEASCAKAGLNEHAFTVAVHRLRKRFRVCVHEQVEMTVADPAETDAEMRHLFGI